MNESIEIRKKLERELGIKIPIDSFLTTLFGEPIIDIIKFDEALSKKFKYHGSIANFIEEKFGKEALELLEKLL
jgi:acyl carrier protein